MSVLKGSLVTVGRGYQKKQRLREQGSPSRGPRMPEP